LIGESLVTSSSHQTRQRVAQAAAIMTDFARRTGLDPAGPQRRYLWTDAFAVGNLLGLARSMGEARHSALAVRLIDGVHHTLGRHRADDQRVGWIKGRSEAEGERHPTAGGLRIGKRLPERRADDPFDQELEWDRDGQYFHYLTKWMHALSQAARATGMPVYAAWARELGKAAHHAFVWTPEQGRSRRMYWKMSIDLSRPLVTSMGQHDALDGYVACLEAEAAAAQLSAVGPSLVDETQDFAEMIQPGALATADPLGIGGLLTGAYVLHRLAAEGRSADRPLVQGLLTAALEGLEEHSRHPSLREPAERRLGFRELGLAIGLEAAALMGAVRLARHARLGEEIVSFWLDPAHRNARSWREHRDINDVMLATALAPEGFLAL